MWLQYLHLNSPGMKLIAAPPDPAHTYMLVCPLSMTRRCLVWRTLAQWIWARIHGSSIMYRLDNYESKQRNRLEPAVYPVCC